MIKRQLPDQIAYLLDRKVAGDKTRGTISSDVDGSGIFELLARNLLLNPKIVYYIEYLARNALTKAINDELTAITTLSQNLSDLTNPSNNITDLSSLTSARASLLALESINNVALTHPSYVKFNNNINSFLNKQLGPNVKLPGSSVSLTRPGVEAKGDLQTSYSALKTAHVTSLSKIYALAVGTDNFKQSAIGNLVGTASVHRARVDLEDIINTLTTNPSAVNSRDVATRLIAARASIKSLSATNLTNIDANLLDVSNPQGYTGITATCDVSSVSYVTNVGPFILPTAASATISVGGTSTGSFAIPQQNFDLNNQAFIVSSAVIYPLTVPASSSLTVVVNNATTYYSVPLTAGSRTLAQVVADINAAAPGVFQAAEYIKNGGGTNKIILYSVGPSQISVSQYNIVGSVAIPTGTTATTGYSLLDFSLASIGNSGSTSIPILVDAINLQASALVTSLRQQDNSIKITTIANNPGTSMTVTIPSVMGVGGTVTSSLFPGITLSGSINGVVTNPIDPTAIMGVGDTFIYPTGTSTIKSLSTSKIT